MDAVAHAHAAASPEKTVTQATQPNHYLRNHCGSGNSHGDLQLRNFVFSDVGPCSHCFTRSQTSGVLAVTSPAQNTSTREVTEAHCVALKIQSSLVLQRKFPDDSPPGYVGSRH
jgi:hypothetical protein